MRWPVGHKNIRLGQECFAALAVNGGNEKRAAEHPGISRFYLYKKIG
ncbi:MAG: hypothetical protein GDA41_05360 [Rhodospirillales bacterium]|nr:hypothetical protein [Rhodospirillales bacterium]